MSNFLQFPGAAQRNEADIEKGLREAFSGRGFSQEDIEAAVALAMPLFREAKSVAAPDLQVNFTSPMSQEQITELQSTLSRALQRYQIDINNFIGKLILQLAFTKLNAPSN